MTRILEAPKGLISNIQYAIVEYKGLFPGHNSHGLSKNTDSIYFRTPSYLMDKIEELSKHDLPRTVYNATSSTKDETSINNMKQIHNKKYYQQERNWNLHINEPMVKGVSLEPNYITFNDYQLSDIERFCCSGMMMPLGFDKPINWEIYS